MNAVVRKEIRLVFPAWVIAMALAVVPAWLRVLTHEAISDLSYEAMGVGLLILGLAPFGQEFSHGTFSMLMAQPARRVDIWRRKIAVLGIAMVIVFAGHFLAMLCWGVFPINPLTDRVLWLFGKMLTKTGLVAIAFVAGGLWTTLLFRQVGAAFWFTILTPSVIATATFGLFAQMRRPLPQGVLTAVIYGYAVVAFLFARWLFFRAQDAQWLGGNPFYLRWTSAPGQRMTAATPRTRGAVRTLLRKEFHLHQASLLIAFGILVLHLVTLFIRKTGGFRPNSETLFALQSVPWLWFLVPWLIGSVAVAEERRLGTLENQLCLPVKHRVQFVIKLGIAFVLGVCLGAYLPLGIESFGKQMFIRSELLQEPPLSVVAIASSILLISFFTSSLMRNTLSSLGTAILVGAVFMTIGSFTFYGAFDDDGWFLCKGPLIFYTAVPLLVAAVVWLAFGNYRRPHVGWQLVWRNLAVIVGSLLPAVIATMLIYHRVWELAVSLEPPSGRVVRGSAYPQLQVPAGKVIALLPDGRVWIGTNSVMQKTKMFFGRDSVHSYQEEWFQETMAVPHAGTFVDGSNWINIASLASCRSAVGVRSDGSLWWILPWTETLVETWSWREWLSMPPALRRIGTEADWKTVVADFRQFVALKKDGTIWHWGIHYPEKGHEDIRVVSEPVQIGSDSDWISIGPSRDVLHAVKSDGAVWSIGFYRDRESLPPRKLDPWQLKPADRIVSSPGPFILVVREDGSASVLSELSYDADSRDGKTFKWLSEEGNWRDIVHIGMPWFMGLKKDGRFIQYSYESYPALRQPSKRSDWIAIDAMGQSITLAADGTLCYWEARKSDSAWLAPSRKPLWSFNILSRQR